MATKLEEFRQREGREPSRFERAALEREASADTRSRKSGHGAADLATRWRTEAAEVGWTADRLDDAIEHAARHPKTTETMTVQDVIDEVSATRSSWGRPDVVQAICDRQRPVSSMSGHRWAAALERSADHVLGHLVDLDPIGTNARRGSDGRSVWIEPTAPRFTSDEVLGQEEHIVAWAMDAQADEPRLSSSVHGDGLDVMQAAAAAAVAGHDGLVLVIGPAGAGKTRMLSAAAHDLHHHGRDVFGVAPTARAARTLQRDAGIRSDTVAKLLHEWSRTDRPPLPEYGLATGTTLLVDESGMLTTPAFDQLVSLADANRWRLVLVGDHQQLQGVGRGGLLAELCANGRVNELERLHRFTHDWEAAASLLLRSGDPSAFDAYEAHDRIRPGTLEDHLAHMAQQWIAADERGDSIALVASSNDHVDTINRAVQAARLAYGQLRGNGVITIVGGEPACIGDVVAARRNDRRLLTTTGEPVRNRDTWTITNIAGDGSITVSHRGGHGAVTLPADYVAEHVRLGYAATEHGYQSDTVTAAIALTSTATTRRGLYVAVTRGRDENLICVITDNNDIADARDVLDGIVAIDRADVPAVTQRRTLAQQQREHEPVPAASVSPRCAIPDWFEPLLDEARLAVNAAEQRHADNAAERARRQTALDVAGERHQQIARRTQPERDALADVRQAAERARRSHCAARRRLDASGLRERRHARQELDVAERRLDRAQHRLDHTEQQTATAVEAFNAARSDVELARADLHHHDLARQLDRHLDDPQTLRARLAALHTWEQWANGTTVAVADLASAVATLTEPHADDRQRALGDAIVAWADDAGVEPQLLRPPRPTLEHTGFELGL